MASSNYYFCSKIMLYAQYKRNHPAVGFSNHFPPFCEQTNLVLEDNRHQRSKAYKDLMQEFYLQRHKKFKINRGITFFFIILQLILVKKTKNKVTTTISTI